MGVLSFVIFVLIFAGMVLVHEFGHFVAARLVKVEVEEFGFGLPPKVMTLFKWRGTDFTLNALPLGGFVRPKGENDPTIPDGLAASAPWKRFVVLSAGPAMNLLVGVLVYALLFAQIGIPNLKVVTIEDVSVNSPAEQAGLKANDIVLRFNQIEINDLEQLRTLIRSRLDQPTEIIIQRDAEQITLTVTPSSARSVEIGATGVLLGNLMESASPITAFTYGMRATGSHVYSLVTLPAQLISGAVSSDQARLVGLKGIFDMTDQAVQRDLETRQTPAESSAPQTTPTNYTLSIIAALTISLGVFNLFPIPALDGGRIIFLLPELLLRRRVPYQVENAIHGVSFLLLLALMIYINVMDFVNPANITLP